MRITGRLPAVIVEYDSRNDRKQRRFDDAYAARRFYAAKMKADKHPTIIKDTSDER